MMSGDDVRDVQEELMARKYSVGSAGADGVYGPDTAQAVKQFQRDKGLRADGVVGPKTTTALGGLWEDAEAAFAVARLLKLTSPMMSGDDVQAVQEALTAQDYDVGVNGADGVYGPDTAKAVQRFQRNEGLRADGIVGPETAQALGGQWSG
jgi:peptidoglycan hydrolase-like protein with peptidoglycan-binding domain